MQTVSSCDISTWVVWRSRTCACIHAKTAKVTAKWIEYADTAKLHVASVPTSARLGMTL